MTRFFSSAIALSLALVPFVDRRAFARTFSPAAISPTSQTEPFEDPYEIQVYMRDTWYLPQSATNPAVQEVRACLERALRVTVSGSTPISATRDALRLEYPNATERASLYDKYTMIWNEKTQSMETRCEKTAVFVVYRETGPVAIEVTTEM